MISRRGSVFRRASAVSTFYCLLSISISCGVRGRRNPAKRLASFQDFVDIIEQFLLPLACFAAGNKVRRQFFPLF